MRAALMAAAAPIQLYDSYFLIEPIESCCEKTRRRRFQRCNRGSTRRAFPFLVNSFHNCVRSWLIFPGPPYHRTSPDLTSPPALARRRLTPAAKATRDPVSKSDKAIILPAPNLSLVDYQISGGSCLWPRRLSKTLICQVYLPLVVSRRRRTKQPLRMEDNADKEDPCKMRNKAFLSAAALHFI